MMRSTLLTTCLLLTLIAGAWAADPGAPTGVVAVDDVEDDAGTQLLVSWLPPTDPAPEGMELVGYQVRVGHADDSEPFETVGASVPAGEGPREALVADLHPWPWAPYEVAVSAVYLPDDLDFSAPLEAGRKILEQGWHIARSDSIGAVRPVGKWFNLSRTNALVIFLLYSVIVIATIRWMASRAADAYIRPIAGLEAVNDAIGRATEMGKPIVYVSGLSGIGSISTIASMLILGHLSKRTAHYGTDIIVPCNDSLVMAAERDIVRQSYLEAGKPDAYKPENIYFLTDSQFGYVAAVDGIMMREKPAACFYMGYFYAEALILAETGNDTGAIQIAGTDADTQLPFFITACDYTLMGEELYAASAYLSRHPLLLAQLRGQDIGKTVLAAVLLLGAIAATWAAAGSVIADAFIKWFG